MRLLLSHDLVGYKFKMQHLWTVMAYPLCFDATLVKWILDNVNSTHEHRSRYHRHWPKRRWTTSLLAKSDQEICNEKPQVLKAKLLTINPKSLKRCWHSRSEIRYFFMGTYDGNVMFRTYVHISIQHPTRCS